jgi:bacterioferritin
VQTSVIDQKVLGYLGRALSLELSAVQMYATQARLVGNWGLEQAADRFRHEAHEEMQHVEKIIARMLAKGVAPNASQLRPVKLGGDLVQLLQVNQRFEMDLVGLYRDAVAHCNRESNCDDRMFFQSLLEDEQRHAAEMADWIASLEANSPGRPRNKVSYGR